MANALKDLRIALLELEELAEAADGARSLPTDTPPLKRVLSSLSSAVNSLPKSSALTVEMVSFTALNVLTNVVTSSSGEHNAALRLQACQVLGFLFTSPTYGATHATATHAWMLKVLRNHSRYHLPPTPTSPFSPAAAEALGNSRITSKRSHSPRNIDNIDPPIDTGISGVAQSEEEVSASLVKAYGTYADSEDKPQSEKDFSGVLLGKAQAAEGFISASSRLGYTLPVMWFPREISDTLAETSQHVFEEEQQFRYAQDKRVELRSPEEKYREIRRKLPKKFLLEQGLEVAFCRAFMVSAFQRLFRHLERVAMRRVLARWTLKVRRARYDAFKRRAAADKLKWMMKRHAQARLSRVWAQWILAAAAILKEQQCAGATALQKVCRGVAGRAKFAAHKKRWYAGVKIQAAWRKFAQLGRYKLQRFGAIAIQAHIRGYLIRRLLRKWHACATLIQSVVRFQRPFRFYLRLKACTLFLQPRIRRYLAQITFYQMLDDFYINADRRVETVVKIQQCWNRFKAGKAAAERRLERELEVKAALSLQKAWYAHKEQMSAYVLMRAIVVEEERGKAEILQKRKRLRTASATAIQCCFRCKRAVSTLQTRRLRYNSAKTLQANTRRFIYQKRCARFRVAHHSARHIQRMFRAKVLPFHTAARTIQKNCFVSFPAMRHCRFNYSVAEQLQAIHVEREAAAERIACFLRCLLAKGEASRRRNCRILQRWVRGCLGRQRAISERLRIRQLVCSGAISRLIDGVLGNLSRVIAKERTDAAIKLQGLFRRRQALCQIAELRVIWRRRTRAAKRIQVVVRRYQSMTTASFLRKMKQNIFRSSTSIQSVATQALRQTAAFFDPFDKFAGMHLAELLAELHLLQLYDDLESVGMEGLIECNSEDLVVAGVAEGKDVQLLLVAIAAVLELREMRKSWLENHRKRFDVQEVSPRSVALIEALQPIVDDSVLFNAYLEHFPDQHTRAINFKSKIAPGTVNAVQLHAHLDQYRGRPKEAKDYTDDIGRLPERVEAAVAAWKEERIRRTFRVYKMAVERIVELDSWQSCWIRCTLQQALKMSALNSFTLAPAGCRVLRVAINLALSCCRAAIILQKHWRRYRQRRRFLEVLLRERYLQEVNNGALLRSKWEREKQEEEEAWRLYHEELRVEEIRRSLAMITRWNWDEIYDEHHAAVYFSHRESANVQWDRPVYDIEEYYAVIRLQLFARALLARKEAALLREVVRKAEELERRRIEWEAAEEDRDNLVSLKLKLFTSQVGIESFKKMDGDLADRAEELRLRLEQAAMSAEDNRALIGRRNVKLLYRKHGWLFKSVKPVSEIEKEDALSLEVEMKEFEGKALAHVYSFQIDPPNPFRLREESVAATMAQAFVRRCLAQRVAVPLRHLEIQDAAIKKLESEVYEVESRRARLRLRADVRISYTKVELPFGWEAIESDESVTYFHNLRTDETQWERPRYTWDEHLAAISMQKIVRGFIGQVAAHSFLTSIDVEGAALQGIHRAEAIGWAGHDPNGFTVQMWFARRGLYHILASHPRSHESKFQRACARALPRLPWTRPLLKSIGITDGTHQDLVLESQLTESVLADVGEKEAEDERVQGGSFVASEEDAVRIFMRHYRDQPARARRFAQRLRESSTPMTYFQVLAHIARYKGQPSLAITQVAEELADLPTLPPQKVIAEICQTLQRVSLRMMLILRKLKVDALVEVLHKALILEVDHETAPGPWLMASVPEEMLNACQLRMALVQVAEACRKAERIQKSFRSYRALKQWRQRMRFLHENACIIQCAWRCHMARLEAVRLVAMRQSPWEELFDVDRDALYYFNNLTKTSQWTAPEEPFKPLDFWPVDPNSLPAPKGTCDQCRKAAAVRVCLSCVNMEGAPKEFCFKCFGDVHRDDAELSMHGFQVLEGDGALVHKIAPCVRCDGPCIRECKDCDELYCTACYRRFHARGKRRMHAWRKYAESPYWCIECEAAIARVHCKTCDDMYCNACSARFHRVGKRAKHETEEIKYRIVKEGEGL